MNVCASLQDLLCNTFPVDFSRSFGTVTSAGYWVEDTPRRALHHWTHTRACAVVKHLRPWARIGRATGTLPSRGGAICEGGLPDAEGLCVVALRARSGVHTFVSASEVGTDGAAALVVVKHTPWLAWQLQTSGKMIRSIKY